MSLFSIGAGKICPLAHCECQCSLLDRFGFIRKLRKKYDASFKYWEAIMFWRLPCRKCASFPLYFNFSVISGILPCVTVSNKLKLHVYFRWKKLQKTAINKSRNLWQPLWRYRFYIPFRWNAISFRWLLKPLFLQKYFCQNIFALDLHKSLHYIGNIFCCCCANF